MSSGTSVPDSSEAPARPSASLAAALDAAIIALAHRPAGLITDIDGTISRIVARPEEATVDPTIRAALEELAGVLDLVAVITARDEPAARRMVGSPGLTYVGNYGLAPGSKLNATDGIAGARAALEPVLAALPCVTIEDKGVAFSLHYRNCPDPETIRLQILDVAAPVAAAANARILEGKKVIELVPAQLPDKRSAFLDLIERCHIRGLVYLGDDLSDIPVFREIARRRAAGALYGTGIVVQDPETDSTVTEAADLAVTGVDEVGMLLTKLAAALHGEGK